MPVTYWKNAEGYIYKYPENKKPIDAEKWVETNEEEYMRNLQHAWEKQVEKWSA